MSFSKRAHELKELLRNSPYRYQLINPTASSAITHPSCGDEVIFSIRIENDSIAAISTMGSGCLLSQAAASLAAAHLHNKPPASLSELSDDILIKLLAIGSIGPTRRQCISIVTENAHKLYQMLS